MEKKPGKLPGFSIFEYDAGHEAITRLNGALCQSVPSFANHFLL
jgi:hypothetical protein